MKRNEKRKSLVLIQQELEKGRAKKDILNDFPGDHYTRSAASRLIASVPYPGKKESFKILNYILLVLLLLSFVSDLYPAYSFFIEQPYQAVAAFIIMLILYYYFINGVARFRGSIYPEITLFALLILFLNLGQIPEFNIWEIAQVLIVLLFAGLAYFLRIKMFPNFGLFGLKKDQDGSYLLD